MELRLYGQNKADDERSPESFHKLLEDSAVLSEATKLFLEQCHDKLNGGEKKILAQCGNAVEDIRTFLKMKR